LVILIHAAKHAATQLGYGVGADGYFYEPDEDALREAGFNEAEMDAVIPDVLALMQRFVRPDGAVNFM
jgi:hypothetical protein